jgi:hypothetical protein
MLNVTEKANEKLINFLKDHQDHPPYIRFFLSPSQQGL